MSHVHSVGMQCRGNKCFQLAVISHRLFIAYFPSVPVFQDTFFFYACSLRDSANFLFALCMMSSFFLTWAHSSPDRGLVRGICYCALWNSLNVSRHLYFLLLQQWMTVSYKGTRLCSFIKNLKHRYQGMFTLTFVCKIVVRSRLGYSVFGVGNFPDVQLPTISCTVG